MIQINMTTIINFIKKYWIYILAIVFFLLYINSCSNTDVAMAEKKIIEKELEIKKNDHEKLMKESSKEIEKLHKENIAYENKSLEKDKIIAEKNNEISKLKKDASKKSKEFDSYDNAQFANYFAELYNAPRQVSYNDTSVSFKGDLPKRIANDLLDGKVAIEEVKIKNTIISEMSSKIYLEKAISSNLRKENAILSINLESSESLHKTKDILINKQNEIIKKANRIKPVPIIIGVGIGVIGTLLLIN